MLIHIYLQWFIIEVGGQNIVRVIFLKETKQLLSVFVVCGMEKNRGIIVCGAEISIMRAKMVFFG